LLMKIEAWLLRRADIVSTISNSMIAKLETKTKTDNYLFPNWVDPEDINPETSTVHDLMKSPKFKVLYSGNIGAKQDWEFFIKIVEHYNNSKDVEFIIVGAGARKDKLVEETSDITNISHHEPIEFAELSNLLCSADLHILFQKNDVVDTVMPSKILGMMASAKPSIVTGNLKSESATLFGESEGGYFFDSDSLNDVIKAIDLLVSDVDIADKVGKKAREYIIDSFSKEKVLGSFKEKIDSIIN